MKRRMLVLLLCITMVLVGGLATETFASSAFFGELTFTNAETGAVLTDSLPPKIKVAGSVVGTEPASAMFIGAVYDENGRVSGVNSVEVSILAEESVPLDLEIPNTGAAAKGRIMCFLWNSFSSAEPISKTAVFADGVVDYHAPASEVYVSLSGSADGDGSEANPFDSIATAKEYINKVKAHIDGDIMVHVEAGEYFLSEPLTFGYEDSGVNGNKIIYQGEEGTVLSGGERITGWEAEENGLYSVTLSDREYVGELYVDDKAAQRANTEDLVYPTAFYNDGTADVGLVIPYDEKIATVKDNDKAELTALADWRSAKFKIEKVFPHPEDGTKLVLLLEDGATATARFKSNNTDSVNANYGVRIENAIGLLDTGNEFYFDKATQKLYFKPEYGKNPDNQKIYIPNLEALLVIRGEHTGKRVTGVIFDGFDFRHTTWKRGETDMYYSFQGPMIYNDVNNPDYLFPQAGMVPSAIQLDMTDDVDFVNNTVACVGAVGVGLYNGVKNSDVTGNIITQTAHGGVTVGVPGLMRSDNKNNVAYRKPVTASSETPRFNAINLTDSDQDYPWISDYTDADTASTKQWCQVDLGKEYQISGVGLYTWGADSTKEHDKNFRILASNDPTFINKTVLLDWYSKPIAVGSLTAFGSGGTVPFTYTPQVGEKYRYVRYEHKGAYGAALGDLEVYTGDDGKVLSKDELLNNTVSNNYISNIGMRYPDAVGIHTFYTKNLTIANNILQDMPYTGISIGWGWERAPKVTAVGNNAVRNNKIVRSLKQLRDGAAIYILGVQPGLAVEGNYIKEIKNSFGGIYPDNGTVGTAANRMSIRNNVVEDSPMWLHAWHPSSEYIDFIGNYTTVSRQKIDVNNGEPKKYGADVYDESGNLIHKKGEIVKDAEGNTVWIYTPNDSCTAENNLLYIKSNPPAEVIAIMGAAGLSEEYEHLYQKTSQKTGDKVSKYDLKQIEMALKAIELKHTYTLKANGSTEEPVVKEQDDVDYWMKHGNRLQEGYGSFGAFKTENLEVVLATYNYYKILLSDNLSWRIGYEAEVAALDAEIAKVQDLYNNSSVTIRDVYQARVDGMKALEAFARCGIFYGKTGTTNLLDAALINRIGYSLSR